MIGEIDVGYFVSVILINSNERTLISLNVPLRYCKQYFIAIDNII